MVEKLTLLTDYSDSNSHENVIRQKFEQYYTLLSHFINNDFQKIVNQLDLLLITHDSTHNLDEEIINQIINMVHHSSRTIDTVSKISEVLQSPFSQQMNKETLNLLNVIDRVIFESTHPFSCSVTINREKLDVIILGDKYLKDVFIEIFQFMLSFNKNNWPIVFESSYVSSQFCVVIQDYCSEQ